MGCIILYVDWKSLFSRSSSNSIGIGCGSSWYYYDYYYFARCDTTVVVVVVIIFLPEMVRAVA